MKIVTYNILNPYHALKHKQHQGVTEDYTQSNWPERRNQVIENLMSSNFDIACLQEVSPTTLPDLKKHFEVTIASWHQNQKPDAIYGNAILINPERFSVIDTNTIRTLNSNYRAAAFARLKDQKNDFEVSVVSAHLQGYNPQESDTEIKKEAQRPGYEELHRYTDVLDKHSQDISILAADFNEDASEIQAPMSRCQYLWDNGFVSDNNLTPTEPDKKRKIDWVFVKSRHPYTLKPILEIIPHPNASDHLPSASEISINL